MEEYQHQKLVKLISLRALPRSLGMLAGAIFILFDPEDPISAFEGLLGVWFIFGLVVRGLNASFVDTNLYSCLSLPVMLLTFWPVKWLAYIAMILISIYNGAPIAITAILFGGIWLVDLYFLRTSGA